MTFDRKQLAKRWAVAVALPWSTSATSIRRGCQAGSVERDVHCTSGRMQQLGGPKLKNARKNAIASIKANADRQTANVLPVIREIQKAGASTLRDLANALNARGIPTARAANGMRRRFGTSRRGPRAAGCNLGPCSV
jgi:hypothetical protein